MNGVVWLFLYTPLPWLVAITVAAYRHDLARLAKPFRDRDGPRAWWSVLRLLGLIEDKIPRPARKVWRRKPLWTLLVASTISLVGPAVLAPLGWYYLVALQSASALGLFLIVVSRIGPIPNSPYADTLRYPRLGTRVRHLRNEKGISRNPAASPTEGGNPA